MGHPTRGRFRTAQSLPIPKKRVTSLFGALGEPPLAELKQRQRYSAICRMKTRSNETTILLLENEENDVFFFRRALKGLGYEGNLQVLASMTKACAYIEGRGQFGEHALPDLIVSDSKLDDGTGAEFFHWLRARPASADIPFILFTGLAPTAVGVALVNAGASAFMTKPTAFPEIKKCVGDILDFLPVSSPAVS